MRSGPAFPSWFREVCEALAEAAESIRVLRTCEKGLLFRLVVQISRTAGFKFLNLFSIFLIGDLRR